MMLLIGLFVFIKSLEERRRWWVNDEEILIVVVWEVFDVVEIWCFKFDGWSGLIGKR